MGLLDAARMTVHVEGPHKGVVVKHERPRGGESGISFSLPPISKSKLAMAHGPARRVLSDQIMRDAAWEEHITRIRLNEGIRRSDFSLQFIDHPAAYNRKVMREKLREERRARVAAEIIPEELRREVNGVTGQLRSILGSRYARMIDTFRQWDKNKNGLVELREFREAVSALGMCMRMIYNEPLHAYEVHVRTCVVFRYRRPQGRCGRHVSLPRCGQ